MACWNRRTGAALSPVISWQDRRNAAWLRSSSRAATGSARTRAWCSRLTTARARCAGAWTICPAVRRAREAGDLAMGPLASFIAFRLLAERPFVADPANASRTQLWDPAHARLVGRAAGALRRAARGAAPLRDQPRGLRDARRRRPARCPLTVVTGDQSAVPFAFGPLDPAAAYVNVGTGAFVQRTIRDRLPEAPRLLASVVWSDAHWRGLHARGHGERRGQRARLVRRARGGGCRRAAAGGGGAAESLEPPLFLNGVSGLGSPFWVERLRVALRRRGRRSRQRLLAVLESIVFLIRVNLDELRPARSGARAGSCSPAACRPATCFCRRLADLTGLPVWRSREPEATARGLAALLARDARGRSSLPSGTRSRREMRASSALGLTPGGARWRRAMLQSPPS